MSPKTAEIPIHPGLRRWQWAATALLAAIVLLALAPCDLAIARWIQRHPPPSAVERAFCFVSDAAGEGTGICILLICIVLYDSSKLRRLPLLLCSALGAGLLADIVKLCVARGRPFAVDLSTATFNSTFEGWFPFTSVGSRHQSFPSGHTATAVGLAIALAITFPRRWWVFAAIGMIASTSRIVVQAHFLTDVVAGAMLASAWVVVCHRRALNRVFIRSGAALERLVSRRDEGVSTLATPRQECEAPTSAPETSIRLGKNNSAAA